MTEALMDVVEAMALAHSGRTHIGCFCEGDKDGCMRDMQAALIAAAAMGYHLAPDERTLPELPPGCRYEHVVISHPKRQGMVGQYLDPHDREMLSIGEVSRAAVVKAISKIDGGKA